MTEPRPFTVHVPDDVLTDLRARLARSRIPDDSPRRPPSGMTAGYLRELVDTWIGWDWRSREEWLNEHPMTEKRLASTMHALMTDVLGHDRYLTYGEDVTANVSDLVAARHPEHVAGIVATHAHFPTVEERAHLTDPEVRAFFDGIAATHRTDGAYGHVQATRPDTLAAALDDSPAGLLAWLTEKLVEWSDTPPGDPRAVERRISRDRILTEATIYWVTRTIASSFRPYYEGADQPDPIPPTSVPAAVLVQRHEAGYPEQLARRHYLDLT